MATKKKPLSEKDWERWGKKVFMPWYDRNKSAGIEPPASLWKRWGEEVYIPWYNQPVAQSNPGDPPPPPPRGGNP